MGAGKIFSELPPWAKGVVAVASTGIIVFIGYQIYAKIQDNIKHAGDYKEEKDVKDDLADLKDKNIKPSYTDSQYSAWANQLFSAFDGYTSDESVVYRVFVNMKNDADVLKLIKAFGVREISSGAGNPQPNYKGTLSGVVADEMDTDEIKELNLILAKRGIKIKF